MTTLVAERLRVLRILWGALLAFSLALVVLQWALPPAPLSKLPSFTPAIFGVIAIVEAVVSFWLPNKNYVVAFGKYRDRVEEVVIPSDDVGYRAENRRRRLLRLDAASIQRVLNISQTGAILSMALSFAISLYGLVLNRTGFPFVASAPFFAAGTLLIALRFPTLEAILARVARVVEAEVEIDG